MSRTGPQPETLAEVAEFYVLRYPDWPKRTLAKLMHRERSELFKSVDNARTAVRRVTGADKGSSQVVRVPKPHGKQSDRFEIPPSAARERKPVHIAAGKIAILSDIHLPIHDGRALKIALEDTRDYDPDVILLNGDVWDMGCISRHPKTKYERDFTEELLQVQTFLGGLLKAFPNAEILYREGNHEMRLAHYIMANAPDFKHLPQITVESLLSLDELGIRYVDEKNRITLGKLLTWHGHERPCGGVMPARAALLKQHCSTLCGHWHRSSKAQTNTGNSDLLMAWSIGCLCDLHPDYMPENEWNHGWAFVDVLENQDFKVTVRDVVYRKDGTHMII